MLRSPPNPPSSARSHDARAEERRPSISRAPLLTFCPFRTPNSRYGYSDACTARVGAGLGRGDPGGAWASFVATLVSMGLLGVAVGVAFVAGRRGVGHLFSDDPKVRGGLEMRAGAEERGREKKSQGASFVVCFLVFFFRRGMSMY